MKPIIRTITFFLDVKDFNKIEEVRERQDKLKHIFEENSYTVQTTRLTTNILEKVEVIGDIKKHEAKIARLEEDKGLSLFHLGSIENPAIVSKNLEVELIETFLKYQKPYVTFNGQYNPREISSIAARICARIRDFDPFKCKSFSVYSGVQSSTPFYPASKVLNNSLKFAIGLQSANLAVEEAQSFADIEDYRKKLTQRLEQECEAIFNLIPINEREDFIGFDTSLAPFPKTESSIVNAIEKVQKNEFGKPGTLATCKLFTEIMQNNNIKKTGLNGLMLAVVEDNILAQRGIKGNYTLKDLMLYSTVCATGLDTVPISGKTSEADLANLYLDLCELANKLNKPLSARLFFEKNKKAGETVKYDWEFAAEAPVFGL